MVGDGALWSPNRLRQLGNAGCSLVEQAQDRRAQLVPDGLNLGRRGEFQPFGEVVVGSGLALHGRSD